MKTSSVNLSIKLFLGIFSALTILSCNKEQDEAPPGITVTAPVEGQVKNFLDVNFSFGDYHLASMDVSILKSSDNSVLFTRHNTYSTVQDDTFTQGFTLSSFSLTASTTVKVVITVKDDFGNTTNKIINCTITP